MRDKNLEKAVVLLAKDVGLGVFHDTVNNRPYVAERVFSVTVQEQISAICDYLGIDIGRATKKVVAYKINKK